MKLFANCLICGSLFSPVQDGQLACGDPCTLTQADYILIKQNQTITYDHFLEILTERLFKLELDETSPIKPFTSKIRETQRVQKLLTLPKQQYLKTQEIIKPYLISILKNEEIKSKSNLSSKPKPQPSPKPIIQGFTNMQGPT